MSQNDQITFFIPLLIGFLGTLIGALPGLVVMLASREKLAKEANRVGAETLQVYDKIEAEAAQRAASRELELVNEIARLRKLCRKHNINPDEIDTGPLMGKKAAS